MELGEPEKSHTVVTADVIVEALLKSNAGVAFYKVEAIIVADMNVTPTEWYSKEGISTVICNDSAPPEGPRSDALNREHTMRLNSSIGACQVR